MNAITKTLVIAVLIAAVVVPSGAAASLYWTARAAPGLQSSNRADGYGKHITCKKLSPTVIKCAHFSKYIAKDGYELFKPLTRKRAVIYLHEYGKVARSTEPMPEGWIR